MKIWILFAQSLHLARQVLSRLYPGRQTACTTFAPSNLFLAEVPAPCAPRLHSQVARCLHRPEDKKTSADYLQSFVTDLGAKLFLCTFLTAQLRRLAFVPSLLSYIYTYISTVYILSRKPADRLGCSVGERTK